MARPILSLTLGALIAVPAAFAADPPSPPAPPPADAGGQKKDGRDDEMLEHFRKKLEKMGPEERERFQENWKRWKQMGEGEKKDWQKRALDEREQVKKMINDAIATLGLELDRDQREVFTLRYHQERRKIEQQICSEMNEKRQAMTDGMLQRLKAEFSAEKQPPATPAATPR